MIKIKIYYDDNGNRRLERKGNFEDDRLNKQSEIISYNEDRNKHIEERGTL